MKSLGEVLTVGRDDTDGCVIFVEVQIAAGRLDEFLHLVRENARRSVDEEAGCRRFDVLLPASAQADGRVLLYEIYDDHAAFDVHLQSAHFLDFDEATRSMVTEKKVAEFRLLEAAK